MGSDTGEGKRSIKWKKLFITLGRERDLIRYSEKSDLKDANEISEEDTISLFKKKLLFWRKNQRVHSKCEG